MLHVSGEISTWLDQVKMTGSSERLYVVAEINSVGVSMLRVFVRKLISDPFLFHVRSVFTIIKEFINLMINYLL